MLEGVTRFARLEWFFWKLVRSMEAVPRWDNDDHPVHTKENVLQHSFKTWMLTLLVTLLERRSGNKDLDLAWLMVRAPSHDFEESCGIGDKPYLVRRDPRVKKLFDELGEKLIAMFLDQYLPSEIAAELFTLFTSDAGHEKEARLFYCIEHIGYVTFALYEIQEAKNQTFYKVLGDHLDTLDQGAKEFPFSIGAIWTHGMRPTVLELLGNKPK
ncbi:MAG: hypothetical protein NTU97_00170 [Candidatus Magasanikbacteria bacterium]|nr:hypothetical protein [Candidatus Magasanikbacteria bacterium]